MKLFSALRTVLFTATLAILSIAASATSNQYFSVTAPVELIAEAPHTGTTDTGATYTAYDYSGSMPNTDYSMVGVGVYPFTIVPEDLQRIADRFTAGLPGGAKVLKSGSVTVDGQPALMQTLETTVEGRTIRAAWLGTYKGNTFYQFVFATYLDVANTDMTQVGTFFSSISLK